MDAFRPDAWHDLAVATVGATAALTGLLFVAVSINLARILEFPWLPRRAGGTLILLLALLAVGVFLLIPGQPLPALAAELGGTGLLLTLPGTAELVHRPTGKDTPRTRNNIVAAFLIILPAAALLAAAATLMFGAGGGLYWVAGALIGGIAAACGNAWVLLVEIQR